MLASLLGRCPTAPWSLHGDLGLIFRTLQTRASESPLLLTAGLLPSHTFPSLSGFLELHSQDRHCQISNYSQAPRLPLFVGSKELLPRVGLFHVCKDRDLTMGPLSRALLLMKLVTSSEIKVIVLVRISIPVANT